MCNYSTFLLEVFWKSFFLEKPICSQKSSWSSQGKWGIKEDTLHIDVTQTKYNIDNLNDDFINIEKNVLVVLRMRKHNCEDDHIDNVFIEFEKKKLKMMEISWFRTEGCMN